MTLTHLVPGGAGPRVAGVRGADLAPAALPCGLGLGLRTAGGCVGRIVVRRGAGESTLEGHTGGGLVGGLETRLVIVAPGIRVLFVLLAVGCGGPGLLRRGSEEAQGLAAARADVDVLEGPVEAGAVLEAADEVLVHAREAVLAVGLAYDAGEDAEGGDACEGHGGAPEEVAVDEEAGGGEAAAGVLWGVSGARGGDEGREKDGRGGSGFWRGRRRRRRGSRGG